MGVQVQFDLAAFRIRFPEFTGVVSDAQLILLFTEGGALYLRNDGTGPVSVADQQLMLLNLLTAHLAQLNYGSLTSPLSPLVGRISSASEGSVSVSTDYGVAESGSKAWFDQTRYGAQFWVATSAYRTMRYYPGQGRNINPWFTNGIGRPY